MMYRAANWCLVTIIFILSTYAEAGTIRHDRAVEEHEGLTAEPVFQSVCRLVENQEDERADMLGSGVLVAPRWILTAAHVAEEIQLRSAGQYWAVGCERYRSVRVLFHPQWQIDKRGGRTWRRDIALVELDQEVHGVEPAVRYRGRDELNRVVTLVGHGAVGTGRVGLLPEIGHRKLAGQNVVDAVGGISTFIRDEAVHEHLLLIDLDGPGVCDPNELGDGSPLDLEMCGNGGDSGGGAFVETQEGEWRLVGVISGGRITGSERWRNEHPEWKNIYIERLYGHVDAIERVSTANEWIDRLVD